MNRQGNDSGTQYRSGIYYTTPEQKQVAEDMIRQMSQDKLFGKPIVTEVLPLSNYWPAEEYHQDFFEKNPVPGLLHGGGRAQGGEVPQDLRRAGEGAEQAAPVIETRSLRYQYPGGPLLSFPDVDVPQGATLLLRGDSGAGKSTWLALVAGLLTPSAGEVVVAGQALCAAVAAPRATRWRAPHLGFLPQKLHLSEALTVERNLALAFYAAGRAGRPRRRSQRALDLLGVAELAGRRPSQLSGGQAQRVALARSILMKPAGDPGRRADGQPGRRGGR